MHLHWGWAVIAAILLGAGLIWWTQPVDASRAAPVDPDRQDAEHNGPSHANAGPPLYRWIDSHGVVNISTDQPPAGRKFTIVRIDPNRNIVPMSDSDSASKAATTAH